MTRAEAVQLFTHMEWADSQIWKAVSATEGARQDRTVMERLHHVHVVQRIYLQTPWAEELVKWFGEARSATVQETIVQVAMHTSHHRGQLCTMIRGHGGEPPLVDFVGWVWMGKPEADWNPLEA